ncbi:MAG: Crp/Fnr family transcriptional regulator [Ignavibacteriales bacterium]|nr:Crp/Fnr family transcriptional regulator [Ignavibacteriales bacterium]
MFDLLHSHIKKRIQITEKEFALLSKYFSPKKLRKKQFFLQEGDVCKHLAFVNEGCLREYSVDHKGEEHIIQFAIKDWWISDLNSYLSGAVSTHNIDAMQESEILVLEKEARDKMLEAVPKMERFFRLLLEANHVATHRRINESLSASAEERYLRFLKTYPALVEQIPQGQIASYLGITPQSLSRIRKELSQKG